MCVWVCCVSAQQRKKNSHGWESISRHNVARIKSCRSATFSPEYQFISKLSALRLGAAVVWLCIVAQTRQPPHNWPLDRDEFGSSMLHIVLPPIHLISTSRAAVSSRRALITGTASSDTEAIFCSYFHCCVSWLVFLFSCLYWTQYKQYKQYCLSLIPFCCLVLMGKSSFFVIFLLYFQFICLLLDLWYCSDVTPVLSLSSSWLDSSLGTSGVCCRDSKWVLSSLFRTKLILSASTHTHSFFFLSLLRFGSKRTGISFVSYVQYAMFDDEVEVEADLHLPTSESSHLRHNTVAVQQNLPKKALVVGLYKGRTKNPSIMRCNAEVVHVCRCSWLMGKVAPEKKKKKNYSQWNLPATEMKVF